MREEGRTHASSSALSASVRVSFDPSAERQGPVVELAPSVVTPKRSSRRSMDCFVLPFFFVSLPLSRGPRCLFRAPGRRLLRGVSIGREASMGSGRRGAQTYPSQAFRSALKSFRRLINCSLFPNRVSW